MAPGQMHQLEAWPVDEERPLPRAPATMSGCKLSAGPYWLPPWFSIKMGVIIAQNMGWLVC